VSDTDVWGALALLIGLALIVLHRPIARWTASPPWREGSRGARVEEASGRRFPWSRRLFTPKGRVELARVQVLIFGAVFVALGLTGLL
jgi:hypothetical protein